MVTFWVFIRVRFTSLFYRRSFCKMVPRDLAESQPKVSCFPAMHIFSFSGKLVIRALNNLTGYRFSVSSAFYLVVMVFRTIYLLSIIENIHTPVSLHGTCRLYLLLILLPSYILRVVRLPWSLTQGKFFIFSLLCWVLLALFKKAWGSRFNQGVL